LPDGLPDSQSQVTITKVTLHTQAQAMPIAVSLLWWDYLVGGQNAQQGFLIDIWNAGVGLDIDG